jgi:pyrroline-5-carboxylate reductase
MLSDLTISFIGSGVMAEAMIKGLLRQNLLPADHIVASDVRRERGEELVARYGVKATQDNIMAAAAADVLVLSVKPQFIGMILKEIGHGTLKQEALVLSIVAGTPIAKIVSMLGHSAVVRVMPNTPAQVGMGMSVWTATSAATEVQREQARAILGALGEEIFMDHEEYLDMATALSGTGPAYIFLVMEALIDAGVHMGFPRWIAKKLVLQTMAGSVEYARQSDLHPAELRNAVTSPGGTSAEALYQLEKGGLRTVISKAVWSAYQKSKYLGGLDSTHD